jgi:hypothetical protein
MGQQPSASRRESFARDMDQLQKRLGSALGQVLDLLHTRDDATRDGADAEDADPHEPRT